MDVSVILVNYNTPKLTQECINSIVDNTEGVKYEIIVVDNASRDNSSSVLQKDNRITFIQSHQNGGFGAGNNIGMQYAKGKYVFLLNTDTILINNAIKIFFDHAEQSDDESVYGCYLVGKTGKPSISYFSFPSYTVSEFVKRYFAGKNEMLEKKIDKEVDVIVGADMFIPRSVIEEVGGFDENIFLNGEECELQYRMKKRGVKRLVLSAPRIIHFGGESQKIDGIDYHLSKGHFINLKLHMTFGTYCLARLYYFMAYLANCIRHPFTLQSWKYMKLSFAWISLDSRLSKSISFLYPVEK